MAAANAEAVAQELQDKLTTTTEEPAADGAPEGGKTKNQLKKEAKVRRERRRRRRRSQRARARRRASPLPPIFARCSPLSLTSHAQTTRTNKQTIKKQAAEKAAREAEKAAAQAQRGVKQAPPTEADPDDPLCAKYGDAPLVQSRLPLSGRVWAPLGALTPELAAASGPDAAADPAARTVLVRARLAAVRGKGKSAFLVLRQRTETIQAVLFADDATVSRAMVRYACAIPKESIVDVEGVLVPSLEPVASCTQSAVELKVRGVWAISRAAGALPFELADACRSADEVAAAAAHGELRATVEQNVRLDNRALDLRTPASQAIFRVQSAVCQLFRATLLATGFQEIHTPKLISGASEGGAAVFSADYMGRPACLAQSPQLYKQMAIVADFERVFEIGPVFRAENSFTHRHLCEFVGLDFEMQISVRFWCIFFAFRFVGVFLGRGCFHFASGSRSGAVFGLSSAWRFRSEGESARPSLYNAPVC